MVIVELLNIKSGKWIYKIQVEGGDISFVDLCYISSSAKHPTEEQFLQMNKKTNRPTVQQFHGTSLQILKLLDYIK